MDPYKKQAEPSTINIPSVVIGKQATPASWKKGTQPAGAGNKGRPAGALNKITRTMKDAAVAAAEELGCLPVSKWEEQLEIGDESGQNGLKGYFKFLAVRHPKSFAIFLARIMPLHVTTSQKPTYLTRDQAVAELKEAGLPPELIDYLRPVDLRTVDPEQVRKSPYDDPEVDDEVEQQP